MDDFNHTMPRVYVTYSRIWYRVEFFIKRWLPAIRLNALDYQLCKVTLSSDGTVFHCVPVFDLIQLADYVVSIVYLFDKNLCGWDTQLS